MGELLFLLSQMATVGVRLFEQTGHNYTYHVNSLTTLNDLKLRFEAETGIPGSMVQIRHQGRDIAKSDDTLLYQYFYPDDEQGYVGVNPLIPPPQKHFYCHKHRVGLEKPTNEQFVDLEIIYDMGGGCLDVYRWRCFFCFLVEFDIANGCTECGICANKMYCRCKDDGCEVACCFERTTCECCVDKCVLL